MNSPAKSVYSLQPLRVPAGWIIGWNTFWGMEIPADGFSGSSLLYCLRHDRRLVIDVEWRPEFDPNGHYGFQVQRQPASREEPGEVEVLEQRESRSREEVAAWVEHWLDRGRADGTTPNEAGRDGPERAARPLRALRIPAGWRIDYNAIRETGASGVIDSGSAGLVFRAVEASRGFRIDATAREGMRWTLEVVHAPLPPHRRGQPVVPPNFDGEVDVVHRAETTAFDALVAQLEHWLTYAYWWAFAGKGRKRAQAKPPSDEAAR